MREYIKNNSFFPGHKKLSLKRLNTFKEHQKHLLTTLGDRFSFFVESIEPEDIDSVNSRCFKLSEPLLEKFKITNKPNNVPECNFIEQLALRLKDYEHEYNDTNHSNDYNLTEEQFGRFEDYISTCLNEPNEALRQKYTSDYFSRPIYLVGINEHEKTIEKPTAKIRLACAGLALGLCLAIASITAAAASALAFPLCIAGMTAALISTITSGLYLVSPNDHNISKLKEREAPIFLAIDALYNPLLNQFNTNFSH